VPGAASFSADFAVPTLDPRWLLLDASPSAAVPLGGALALAPQASPTRTLLLQAAPAGDLTVLARVMLPRAALSSVEAGILLYLDTGDSLALGVSRSGVVALCPVVWSQVVPCRRLRLARTAALYQGIDLRITRRGDTFTGTVSLDGGAWSMVGIWQPDASDTATPATESQPEAAPLAFTSVGLFAQDAAASDTPRASLGSPHLWPDFAEFAVATAPSDVAA
jgi:hypothetical protein